MTSQIALRAILQEECTVILPNVTCFKVAVAYSGRPVGR
jgi:hypothetical protein